MGRGERAGGRGEGGDGEEGEGRGERELSRSISTISFTEPDRQTHSLTHTQTLTSSVPQSELNTLSVHLDVCHVVLKHSGHVHLGELVL